MPKRHTTVTTLALGLGLGLALAAGGPARAQAPAGAAVPLPPSTPPPAPTPGPSDSTPSPVAAGAAVAPVPTAPFSPLSAPGTAAAIARSTTDEVLVPVPTITSTPERSGLMGRFEPIAPHLPPDPRRDQWYDTRWGDAPNLRPHPNAYHNGGIYGLPWKATCTQSFAPYFYGAPGNGRVTPDCKPCHNAFRLSRAILHPFKPVGMYYDQGSYVPVYDLDPVVPGPTAWPWPFYRRLTSWGG